MARDEGKRMRPENAAVDDICASVGLDLTKRFMQLQDIKRILAQANGT